MTGFKITTEFILMMLPLVAIQLGLVVFSIVKIFKEGVRNLNKWLWLVICVLVNIIGPVLFLTIGRKKDYQ